MFVHKKIYKITNLKVHSKGRYLVCKKFLFKNYNEWLVQIKLAKSDWNLIQIVRGGL